LLVVLVVSGPVRPCQAHGVVLARDSGDGQLLLGELGCAACHQAGPAADHLTVKQAPRLAEVGARITPAYLRAFLAAPHKVKPGTPMPHVLHGLAPEKRAAAVEDLVNFLAAQGGPLERGKDGPARGQVERGKALYHSVGCVACHEPFIAAPKRKIDPNAQPDEEGRKDDPQASVPLGNLLLKTTVPALARFLESPLHVRPSGRMPSLGLSRSEAAAIAAYLLSLPGAKATDEPAFTIDPSRVERGRERFASAGCASCHDTGVHSEPKLLDLRRRGIRVVAVAPRNNSSPNGEDAHRAIDNNPRTKYLNFGKAGSGLLITLPNPVIITGLELTAANDSPDRDPAAFLLEGSDGGKVFHKIDRRAVLGFADRYASQSFTFDNSEAYLAYRLTFPQLQGGAEADAMQIADVRLFAADKPRPGVASTLTAAPLAKLDPAGAGGCLDPRVAAGRPRFSLTDEQRTALRTALAGVQKAAAPPTAAQRIDRTLTAFNCYGCHMRGGKGGPDSGRAAYFGYEVVVDLGDEGRLPPALNEVGAKLTTAGFDDALFDGARYRTYMATRMPRFGGANLKHLPELFRRVDAGKVPSHKPAFAQSMVDDGRRLAGKSALTCVSCHAWGGYRAPGAEGLDLLEAYKRLQPAWFHALLVEPQRLRPRTRMPSSWPDGKSFYPNVQGGDMHRQIDAIWAYLGQGVKAGAPDGISTGKGPFLVPDREPIVFRTFLDGVSAHAILVGFRQRTHVVFDANRVRMVQAWAGDFISPASAWEGRGGNYAKVPSSDVVAFPAGPPLAVLQSQSLPWPKDVPQARMGTRRTPPGWRYLGYRLDDEGVPTFLYRAGAVRVEETPTSESRQASGCLVRLLRLSADEAVRDFYLRVATGKKIEQTKGAFVIDGRLTYRLQIAPQTKPFIRTVAGQQELLVPIHLAPRSGGKEHQTDIVLDLTW
jgi:mono/diheme cytochrome c family protein